MSEHIKISREERVVTLTIDRQDKKNALTQEMYGAMADALEAYSASDEDRALVITGAGEMFTAGNDLGDFARVIARKRCRRCGVFWGRFPTVPNL